MGRPFSYAEHIDSHHSTSWTSLRKRLCPDDPAASNIIDFASVGVDAYAPLRRHRFSTSAILTLQSPERTANPFDLRMFRTRWPALLHNCSVRAARLHGVGIRFGEVDNRDGKTTSTSTLPEAMRANPVDLLGHPGDLYIFNSEFVHTTPTIAGSRERIVLGAVLGYSRDSREVEVWS